MHSLEMTFEPINRGHQKSYTFAFCRPKYRISGFDPRPMLGVLESHTYDARADMRVSAGETK